MKKFLAIAVLIILIAIPLAGCKEKTPVTKDEFVNIMQEQGAEIHDATTQFDANVVDSVTLAVFDDFQVEFFVLKTVEDARSTFESNKNTIESSAQDNNVRSSVEVTNNAYLKMTSGDTYNHIVRVEKTFIYVSTAKENKEKVQEYIELLGY